MFRASTSSARTERGLLRVLCALAMILAVVPSFAAEESASSLQAAFMRGQYETVLAGTRRLLKEGGSSHPDELLYLQGISALKLKNRELARASLSWLLSDHPNSRWADLAARALKGASKAEEEIYFSVQVGAFGSRSNGVRLKNELDRRGYKAKVSEVLMEGRRFYRVRVGRFSGRVDAEQELRGLKAEGFPGEVVE